MPASGTDETRTLAPSFSLPCCHLHFLGRWVHGVAPEGVEAWATGSAGPGLTASLGADSVRAWPSSWLSTQNDLPQMQCVHVMLVSGTLGSSQRYRISLRSSLGLLAPSSSDPCGPLQPRASTLNPRVPHPTLCHADITILPENGQRTNSSSCKLRMLHYCANNGLSKTPWEPGDRPKVCFRSFLLYNNNLF